MDNKNIRHRRKGHVEGKHHGREGKHQGRRKSVTEGEQLEGEVKEK